MRKKIKLNTPEEEAVINKAALSDPANPPMTDAELARMRPTSGAIPHITNNDTKP